MVEIIQRHDIKIEIFDKKPEMKYRVEHTQDGEIIVTRKDEMGWQEHSIFEGCISSDGFFKRNFLIYCEVWTLQMYQQQWKDGLIRLDMHNKSCLVMKIDHSRNIPSVEWWLLYKIGKNIHIQYDYVFGSNHKKQIGDKLFNIRTCYDFIPERIVYEDDGLKKKEIIIKI
jgi:CdiI N-terminal domain